MLTLSPYVFLFLLLFSLLLHFLSVIFNMRLCESDCAVRRNKKKRTLELDMLCGVVVLTVFLELYIIQMQCGLSFALAVTKGFCGSVLNLNFATQCVLNVDDCYNFWNVRHRKK